MRGGGGPRGPGESGKLPGANAEPWPAEVRLGLTKLRARRTQDSGGNMLVQVLKGKPPGPTGYALGKGAACLVCLSHSPMGWVGSRQVRELLPSRAEHLPEGPEQPPLTLLRAGSQAAPLTLRLLHRWPLALSQWQKELCCPSAFPESEACIALQVWKTAFTRGLLGGERGERQEVSARRLRRMKGEPKPETTAPSLL